MKKINLVLILIGILSFNPTLAINKKDKKVKKETKYKSSTFNGLKFRNIGPALTSGRIADIAVNPNNTSEYYIAVASGGVWKTINSGTTYKPIFDNEMKSNAKSGSTRCHSVWMEDESYSVVLLLAQTLTSNCQYKY